MSGVFAAEEFIELKVVFLSARHIATRRGIETWVNFVRYENGRTKFFPGEGQCFSITKDIPDLYKMWDLPVMTRNCSARWFCPVVLRHTKLELPNHSHSSVDLSELGTSVLVRSNRLISRDEDCSEQETASVSQSDYKSTATSQRHCPGEQAECGPRSGRPVWNC